MNLTAWPGRGLPPRCRGGGGHLLGEGGHQGQAPAGGSGGVLSGFPGAVVCRGDPGLCRALVGPEPWEPLIRAGHTKAAVHLFMEHPKLDGFIDRLAVEPDRAERVRIMRDEMGPGSMSTSRRGHWRRPCHHGGGAAGGGMALDPRPYGVPQLGVCDPWPLVPSPSGRGRRIWYDDWLDGYCRRC